MPKRKKPRHTVKIPINVKTIGEIQEIIDDREDEDYLSPSDAIREAIREWLDKKKRQETYLRSESRNNL